MAESDQADGLKRALYAFAENFDTGEGVLPQKKKSKAVNGQNSTEDSLCDSPALSDDAEQDKKRSATATAAAANSTPSLSDAMGPRRLQAAPYFFYRDFSREQDEDPLASLTPPGSQPSFPAKMHDILSRSDFADIISWLPHGRAWRILNPRLFESRVIPAYFEHSKLSSFVRQTNGWGFRRIKNGCDRNAYYHERFLRGLPHLSKKMKRLGVAEKNRASPDHEPDLYKISQEHPVPEKASADDGILLDETLRSIAMAKQSMPPNPPNFHTDLATLSSEARMPYTLWEEPTPLPPSTQHASSAPLISSDNSLPTNLLPQLSSQDSYASSNQAQQITSNAAAAFNTNYIQQEMMPAIQQSYQAPFNFPTSAQSATSNNIEGAQQMAPTLSESLSQFAAGFATGTAAYTDNLYATLNRQNQNTQANSSATTVDLSTMPQQNGFSSSLQDFQNLARFQGNN